MNDRLQLNATVFFTDYKQKQEDVVFPDPVAVTQTLVQNAADATLNGLELELVAVPLTDSPCPRPTATSTPATTTGPCPTPS